MKGSTSFNCSFQSRGLECVISELIIIKDGKHLFLSVYPLIVFLCLVKRGKMRAMNERTSILRQIEDIVEVTLHYLGQTEVAKKSFHRLSLRSIQKQDEFLRKV